MTKLVLTFLVGIAAGCASTRAAVGDDRRPEVKWSLLERRLETLPGAAVDDAFLRNRLLIDALGDAGWQEAHRSNVEKLRLAQLTFDVAERAWGAVAEDMLRVRVPRDLSELCSIPNVIWIKTLYKYFDRKSASRRAFDTADYFARGLELFSPQEEPYSNLDGYGQWAAFIRGTQDGIPPHDLSQPEFDSIVWFLLSGDPERATMYLYSQMPHLAPKDGEPVAVRLQRIANARKLANLRAEAALKQELGGPIRTEDRAKLDPERFIPEEVRRLVYELAREGGWLGQLYALRLYGYPGFRNDPKIIQALRESGTDYAQRLLSKLSPEERVEQAERSPAADKP